MSYQVLARKWRPKNFQEMVGQEHVLKALVNALDNDRLHHAYLFTGTRGVGKTTVARVLAKCLNCETGVTSKPCGVCSACVAIDEGRFVDLIEVDAASRAKVDETRELMENVQYSPTVGRFKVYLIDEVHMFSNHSFNALLKTLEEPPPHVKFLLATTELKKVPVTILSRCLQFNLKNISAGQIQGQLQHVLEQESIEHESAACEMIARAANGSLRDALSLLDQAISFSGGSLETGQVRQMLGTIDSAELTGLIEDLFAGKGTEILQRVELLAEHNPDYEQILIELASLLQQIALLQIIPDEASPLSALAASLDKEKVQLFYQIALLGRRDLYLSPEPRMGFEMTLIRMLAFEKQGPVSIHSEYESKSEQKAPVAAVKSEASASTQQNAGSSTTKPEVASITNKMTSNDWKQIIDEMALAGLVKELAGHCVLKEHSENKVVLQLTPEQEHLLKTNQKDKLQSAIHARFGEQVKLIIEVERSDIAETPVQERQRLQNESQARAEQSIANDPNIKDMQEFFGATVDKSSIQPGD